MNDNTTHNSLLDSYESSEIALMDSFKAAALKVTTLYKDSLVQNRKAYVSGYQQALQELYEFISSHPKTSVSQQGTIMSPTEHGFLPVQDLLTYARQRNDQLTSEMGVSTGMDQSTLLSSSSSPVDSEPQQPQPQTILSTNIPPSFDMAIRSQQHDFNDSSLSKPTHIEDSGLEAPTTTALTTPSTVNTVYDGTNTTGQVGGIGVTVKNAFHRLQIHPNTQFTFSLPMGDQPWHNPGTADHHYRTNRNHHHTNNNSNINTYHHQREYMNEDDDSHAHHLGNNTFPGFSMDGAAPMDGFKRRFAQQEL